MLYINIKNNGVVETIDEVEGKEALRLLKEYRLSDSSNHYYLSQRSTKEWRESK